MLKEIKLRPQKAFFQAYGLLLHKQIEGLRAMNGAREGRDKTGDLISFLSSRPLDHNGPRNSRRICRDSLSSVEEHGWTRGGWSIMPVNTDRNEEIWHWVKPLNGEGGVGKIFVCKV